MSLAHSTLAGDGRVCPCGWQSAPRFCGIYRRQPCSSVRTPPGIAGAIPFRVARRPDPVPPHLRGRRRARRSAHKASPGPPCQPHLRPGPIPMEPDPGKLSTLFPPSLDRQIYVCGAAIIVLGRIISKIYATGDQVYNCSSPFVNELKLSSEAESRKGIFSCAIENRSV